MYLEAKLFINLNILKTLFNIVEERLKKLLNFDVPILHCCINELTSERFNKQPGMQKF